MEIPRCQSCIARALSWALLLTGCTGISESNTVVVYTALDAEFSAPILEAFSKSTGVEVVAKFDAESTKTVGLTQAIMAEERRPRADVFWNNEILNTLRLERAGLLEIYMSPAGRPFPPQWRSSAGAWHGFAARARVLLVNTQIVSEESRPRSIHDLKDPRWEGRTGIAKPLFGTTATHAACLFAALGDDAAREYFVALKANKVQIMAGNKQVAQAVADGQLAFGLTDTDDAIMQVEAGRPVVIIYPDQGPHEIGALFIPNTLAIIKRSPNPVEAQRLVDYLLAPEVEARLAQGASAQIPLNPIVDVPTRVETPRSIKAMKVDFDLAADYWDQAAKFIRDQFAATD